MNKTILLAGCFLLAFLALAGCAAAVTPTPAPPTSPAPEGSVAPNSVQNYVTVTLELPYAPRLSETVILTWTVAPNWSNQCWERLHITKTPMTTWIGMPPGTIVEEIPPGVTWTPAENVPWNCYGCIGVLQVQEVLYLGESRQYTVPIRFIAEGEGWGGFTGIFAAASLFVVEGVVGGDVTTLDLTITNDSSHLGYPEGYEDYLRIPRQSVPGDDSPPTTEPSLIEAAVTPDPADSPPLITPVPATIEIP